MRRHKVAIAFLGVAGLAVVALASPLRLGVFAAEQSGKTVFVSPPDSTIPDNDFGKMVKLGKAIFDDTAGNAAPFVGNKLRCANCHLGSGRLAYSAPLGPAYVMYPQYRKKNRKVDTYEDRLRDCFRYSMNGTSPPRGDKVLVALESYSYFLSKGAPSGEEVPGRGYAKLAAAPNGLDYARGAKVFTAKCAACHGADGAGQMADTKVIFPPLWGPSSFNWGAGMSRINNAAGFIKSNMPLGQGNSLTDQEAWDVAAFIDSHERPQDPRFIESVAATRAKFHDDPMSMYGKSVEGTVLGAAGPPTRPTPAETR